ncbi:MAG: hypothetical protein JXQ27_03930 [Acidobacteria bacterium]|nr:hypothetical protein [Acidobacteriota bacterium]
MKQLTILCSDEIRERIIHTLNRVDTGGYAEVGQVSGNRPKDPRYLDSRGMSWPAAMFVMVAEEAQVRQIVDELKDYAGHCDVQPCLRIMVLDLAEYY